MSPARAKLPQHLKKYVVDQNYARYTPENQAVWRYMMRVLKDFLSTHAHSCYLEGLSKTGINVDQIPSIDEMDSALSKFGWGAVPVSGFIPPSAFMEFQSLGILPIASDMRTLDHLLYTPAPDIVHEAAGHAPILVDPKFSSYLRRYAEVASKAIISSEDLEIYVAIRDLSDIKENPDSAAADVQAAEKQLERALKNQTHVSEAALLSRMNWWTAEYGLIGNLEKPRIFGAGLLSSPGESHWCLDPKVKKIPLSVDCINYSYDITEPQPQLFVTPDFETLHRVLDQMAAKLAYRVGGAYGLEQARLAQTITTVQLDSGLQISGQLKDYRLPQQKDSFYLSFTGPCQLSYNHLQLQGHDKAYHPQGFGSPVGNIKNSTGELSSMSDADLAQLGVKPGQPAQLDFISGVQVRGQVDSFFRQNNQLLIIRWTKCTVTHGDNILFQPEWGNYDMAVGSHVSSVFGGAADRTAYGETEDFKAKKIPKRQYSGEQLKQFEFYQQIRQLREHPERFDQPQKSWAELLKTYVEKYSRLWLPGVELIELAQQLKVPSEQMNSLTQHLNHLAEGETPANGNCIREGLRLSTRIL